MSMHFSKIKISFMFFVFLGLASYSLSSLATKPVNAYDYLINYNNNYNIYISPDAPDKESALKDIDCVINIMQRYAFTSSPSSSSLPGLDTCNKDKSTTTNDDNSGYQANQGQNAPPIGNTQQITQQDTSIGIVKVINLNGSDNTKDQTTFYSHSSYPAPTVTYLGNTENENTNDIEGQHNNVNYNYNDNDNNVKKAYNENTVTKEQRKILLKACFERAEDKGNYISSNEMKECAENYNS